MDHLIKKLVPPVILPQQNHLVTLITSGKSQTPNTTMI